MKSRIIKIGLILSANNLPLCYYASLQKVYALRGRDLELVFVVTNAETGSPIPGAVIRLTEEKYGENGPEEDVTKLVADEKGTARFVRKNNSCEDIIRPFRKTVTLIDLTWASVTVSAEGHIGISDVWLHSSKRVDEGYIASDRVQRVRFTFPLHKQFD